MRTLGRVLLLFAAVSALMAPSASAQTATLTIVPVLGGIVSGPGISCGDATHTDCTETYAASAVITLEARALSGYVFVSWSDGCEGTGTITMVMTAARRCSAVVRGIVGAPSDPQLAAGSLIMESEPGNILGGGRRIAALDVSWNAQSFINGLRIDAVLLSAGSETWTFVFTTGDAGGRLGPGQLWLNTMGISRSGGPPCSSVFSRFFIHEFTPAGATLGRYDGPLAIDFEQRCGTDANGPAIRGSLRVNSHRTNVVPFDADRVPTPPFDMNRDGAPDLIWRHTLTGHNAVWFMSGTSSAQTTFLGPTGADQLADRQWEIRATGDLNRDGFSDLIWQNAANGQMAVWYMAGSTRLGTDYLHAIGGAVNEPDLDWKIVAAADMNNDADVDLVWHHRTSGATRVWHLNGAYQFDTVSYPTVPDTQWEIAGVADMNQDSYPDLVWRHYGYGGVATWLLQDRTVLNTLFLSPAVNPDVNWRIVGVADMNRDGSPDLVWQHATNGQLGVWFIRGLTMIGGGYLTPAVVPDLNWKIVGVR
jgi:hypothetical protein